ncbi:MAG TPA: hypothetical protein VIT91_04105 [Chthoniobacterales bacterium]
MNGGILQPSTEIDTSLRGTATLKTPSSLLSDPFSPVSCSICAVSRDAVSAELATWNRVASKVKTATKERNVFTIATLDLPRIIVNV